MLTLDLAATTVGIIGVALIVLAYFLVSTDRITGKNPRYHALNFVGALLVFLSLMVHWNTPSVVIECVWMAISLYGLWRHGWCKRNQSEPGDE